MAVNVRYKQSTGALGIASNGTTAVTVLTFGTSLKGPDGNSGPGGIVDTVRVYNADTVQHGVELHLVPNGDAAGIDTLIDKVTLAAGEVYRFIGPERAPDAAMVQIKLTEAHTTNPVYAKADVSELY